MPSPLPTPALAPVFTATIASMVLGSLWYSPMMFGKQWMKATKRTEKDCKQGMGSALLQETTGTLIAVYVLAILLELVSPDSLKNSLWLGVLLWLGCCVPIALGEHAWEHRPLALLVINATYRLSTILLAVLIVAGWA